MADQPNNYFHRRKIFIPHIEHNHNNYKINLILSKKKFKIIHLSYLVDSAPEVIKTLMMLLNELSNL
jgi:hypothetical protein